MNPISPLPSPPNNDNSLSAAVLQMAQQMHAFCDADLGQPWAWGPHDEGVRFALLGAYQELRELAVRLGAERRISDPLTTAQHALAQYHAAYRDLRALLLGVDDDLAGREPAPGEWSVRTTLGHILRAERGFFTLVQYGLRRQRENGDLPERLPEGEVDRLLDNVNYGELHEILAYYDALHGRVLVELAAVTEQEIQGTSLWWEDIRYPLQHRLHRFDAHLRQHTVQIEKALDALVHRPTEAKRLLRLVFNALAEVEGFLIGAPDLALDERGALAANLRERSAEIADLINETWRLQTAVFEGNKNTVSTIFSAHPALVNAQDQQGLPLVLTAVYHRQLEIAALFVEKGAELSIFEAAALGDLAFVQQEGQAYPEDITAYGLDGFTVLHLACYFGHEDIARWLLENGAEVTAVSRNEQTLQAIHAATANNSFAISRLLLEHGADANAQQADGFTPLQAAEQNGNRALAGLLLDFGANPT